MIRVTLFVALISLLVCLGVAKYNAAPTHKQSAVCADGTISYSKNRSGTCAAHGGVARWLN